MTKVAREFKKDTLQNVKNELEMLKGSELTPTNNEIKNIMKVISSLENKRILLKASTNKIISQKGGFLNFLRPLMTAGSPLMANVLTTLAKTILAPLELTAAASPTDAAIQKKIFALENDCTDNLKQRNGRCQETS